MARPAEFNRDEVLDKAMQVFWEKGYEATSLSDLTERMGIKRQSLYYAFGSKHELYMEALKRYVARDVALISLSQSGSIKECLSQVFQSVIEAELCDTKGVGCFLTNATLERASYDHKLLELVKNSFDGGEALFAEVLEKAQQRGEISEERDVKALAHHFMNTLNGLRVTAKGSRQRETLENVATLALSILD